MIVVAHALAMIGMTLGASLLLCATIGWRLGDSAPEVLAMGSPGAWITVLSIAAWLATRHGHAMNRRHALLLVVSSWLLCGCIGAIPYLTTGACQDVTSALFESFSGFTTTGASVLTGLEEMSRCLLLWRSFTHFLGGIGILVMLIAVLPFFGVIGLSLYATDASGFMVEKITPRLAETARIIAGIYVALNAGCILALRLAGLNWFDAVCQAFGTIATGGFSTRSEGIAAFQNSAAEWVLVVFMFVAGINFVVHYHALLGHPSSYLRNEELRVFSLWIAIATGFSVMLLLAGNPALDTDTACRQAAFQVVSMASTTGFTTVDYDPWPAAIKVILLAAMMIGACAGSTSGAIKSVRFLIAGKAVIHHLRSMLVPSLVESIKVNGHHVDQDHIYKALSYIVLYLATLVAATVLLCLSIPDARSALSAVIACLGGVGPGMSLAGPTETYASFTPAAKLLLIACMLLGRLEIHVCIAMLLPRFWRH